MLVTIRRQDAIDFVTRHGNAVQLPRLGALVSGNLADDTQPGWRLAGGRPWRRKQP